MTSRLEGSELFMAALHSRCAHYIFDLFLLSIFFLSSPNLSRRRLDVYHTSTHCVALVQISNAGLKTCCTRLAENTGCKNSPSVHHCTTLSGYIFATQAHIDNRKKLVTAISRPHIPYNMVNFGPLAPEISWRVWGTPANFNGFCVLAALLHGTLVVGVSQTLWH